MKKRCVFSAESTAFQSGNAKFSALKSMALHSVKRPHFSAEDIDFFQGVPLRKDVH
jgi:hypothetical protein